jgi:hypothetical protein
MRDVWGNGELNGTLCNIMLNYCVYLRNIMWDVSDALGKPKEHDFHVMEVEESV